MEQLPKGVRERLAAAQGRGVTAHPDADMLNAFAENALLSAERERVHEHLSLCAECRDIVSLALPEIATEPVPARAVPESRGIRWSMFRWAGVAAAAVVVSAAVLVYQSKTSNHYPPLASDGALRPAASADGRTSGTTEVSQAPSAGSTSEKKSERDQAPPARANRAAENAPRKLAALPQGAVKKPGVLSDQSSTVELQQAQPFAIAAEQPRQNVFGEIARPAQKPVAAAPRTMAKVVGGQQQSVQMEAAQGPISTTVAAPPPPKSRADQATNYDQTYSPANNAGANAAGQTYANVAANSAPVNVESAASENVTSNAEMVNQLRDKAQAPAESKGELRSLAAQAKSRSAPNLQTALTWRISNAGQLEHSTGNGVWQHTLPAGDVRFRAVATIGREVWAGGSGGALYHSTDAGASWTRMDVAANGRGITGDVVHIEVRSPQHVGITTSSGQAWTTADGGMTWTMQ